MKSQHFFIILVIILLLVSSCKLKVKVKGSDVQCTDGRIVTNLSECNVTQTPPPPRLNVSQPVVNTTILARNATLQNFSTNRKTDKQENATKNTTGTSLPKLNGWSVPEIIEGMGTYNKKFQGAFYSPINYIDDRNYFLGNTGPKVYDPFAIARRSYVGDAREYDVNHLRIFLTQTPYEFFDMVSAKHADSKLKIVYPDQWDEWAMITCAKIASCRNIEAIECVKSDESGEHHLSMWTHNTPGPSYTKLTKYNMQAFDDNRETITTFEQFYCTPV